MKLIIIVFAFAFIMNIRIKDKLVKDEKPLSDTVGLSGGDKESEKPSSSDPESSSERKKIDNEAIDKQVEVLKELLQKVIEQDASCCSKDKDKDKNKEEKILEGHKQDLNTVVTHLIQNSKSIEFVPKKSVPKDPEKFKATLDEILKVYKPFIAIDKNLKILIKGHKAAKSPYNDCTGLCQQYGKEKVPKDLKAHNNYSGKVESSSLCVHDTRQFDYDRYGRKLGLKASICDAMEQSEAKKFTGRGCQISRDRATTVANQILAIAEEEEDLKGKLSICSNDDLKNKKDCQIVPIGFGPADEGLTVSMDIGQQEDITALNNKDKGGDVWDWGPNQGTCNV